ncbi:MAG: dihydrodipicolinate synthase family protein [Planctomycetota bacterium]|jgi:dihydrodipicolinate synthase/N-acetylneuraminate lyase
MSVDVKKERDALRMGFFGEWMPGLWCPPLTHYTDKGEMDFERMARHLVKMSKRVKAFLVPGSTSDGWELNKEENHLLLEYYLEMSKKLGIHLLVGMLRTETAAAREGIGETMKWFRERSGKGDSIEVMKELGVCGFTVCADKGKGKTQEEIYEGLRGILELKVPTALYQLPQVTENEFSPETAGRLAGEFSNFYLFKDSSGADKVALSGIDLEGVFLLRGAEGDYWKWQKSNSGPYDGFLLGSANCFAEEISMIIEQIGKGEVEKARELSERVTNAVRGVTEAVKDFPAGNAFTNSTKAIDHYFAHGEGAMSIEPPMLHAGVRLEKEFIETAGNILRENGLMPSVKYL